MKKVVNIPAASSDRAALAPVRLRMRRMRSGRMGFASRASSQTKAASRATEPPPTARVCAEVQPYSAEVTIA